MLVERYCKTCISSSLFISCNNIYMYTQKTLFSTLLSLTQISIFFLLLTISWKCWKQSHDNASIEKTSHELLKKYIASFAKTFENRTLKKKTFLIMKWAEWLRSIREHLMKLWKWVAEQQAKYYNTHHKVASFQMKDKVLLQSINIHTLWSKKKIDHR